MMSTKQYGLSAIFFGYEFVCAVAIVFYYRCISLDTIMGSLDIPIGQSILHLIKQLQYPNPNLPRPVPPRLENTFGIRMGREWETLIRPASGLGRGWERDLYDWDGNGVGVAHPKPAPLPILLLSLPNRKIEKKIINSLNELQVLAQ